MRRKRRRNRIITVILVAAMLLGNIPYLQTVKAETQPVELIPTNQGVADSRVKAWELKLSDDAEIIDVGIPELLVVKENWFGAKVKIHLVGKKGILHTFEVDMNNPWLSEFEEKREIENYQTITGNFYKISGIESWIQSTGRGEYLYFNEEWQCFEDSIIVVRNPDTGRYDLLNLTEGKYYNYNFEVIFPHRKAGNQYIVYKQDDKYGFLNKHGEKITRAFARVGEIAFSHSSGALIVWTGNGISLVNQDGSLKGEKDYDSFYSYSMWYDDGYSDVYDVNEREEYGAFFYNDGDYTRKIDYINFKTGEKREVTNMAYNHKKSFSDGTIAFSSNGIRDELSGEFGRKGYLVKPEGDIDLNTKLGGDYCDLEEVSNQSWPGPSAEKIESWQNEYIYAASYSFVLDEDHRWIRQYEYQGLIDSDGNKVYGYTYPEKWNTAFLVAENGYALIAENIGDQIGVMNETYVLKLIDLSGKVYYTQTDYLKDIIQWYEHDGIRNYYSSERYISFKISGEGKTLLFNKTEGTYEKYDLERIVLYDEWIADGCQYAMTVTEEGYHNSIPVAGGIFNLDTGDRFEFEERGGSGVLRKDLWIEQKDSGEIFLVKRWFSDERYEDDDLAYILDKQLKPVMTISGYPEPEVIEFSENAVITNMGIYDYKGNPFVSWEESGLSYSRVKNNDLFRIPEWDGANRYIIGWTFCDHNGNLSDETYPYDKASEYFKGAAYVTYGNWLYDEYLAKVIDSSGRDLISGTFDDRFITCINTTYSDIMAEQGLFMKAIADDKETWIFYDFSQIHQEIDEGAEKEVKEEEKYNSLLEKAQSLPDFSLNGMKTKFQLPDSVPAIGGEEISLDLSFCPIAVEKSGNEFRIGIGLDFKSGTKGLFYLKKEKWNTLKKLIEEHKEEKINEIASISQNGNKVNIAKQKVKSSIYGYAEGVVENNKVKAVHGKIVIKMEYSISKKWQEVVVSVPVVLTASLKAGLKTEGDIGVDFSKAEVKGVGTMNFTLPEIKLTAGVGIVEVADVSVYGAVKNVLVMDNSVHSDVVHMQDYIEGEMGVSATVLLASYEKVLWPGKKLIVYDSTNGMITSKASTNHVLKNSLMGTEKEYKIDRSYAQETSAWEDETVSTDSANAIHVLQKNVYQEADPKIITTSDGLKMMVYVADVSERATGNHTAIVYSVYDNEQEKWSEPELIEDDGTADFYPSITTDENEIYVAWTDAKTDRFTEHSSVSEIAEQCEISLAKYNRETQCFDIANCLTENDTADIRPTVFAEDGNVYVTWLENQNNDLIGLSGINQICYSVLENGILHGEPDVYASCEEPVYMVKGGIIDGRPAVAYSTDQDGDLYTTDDSFLYAGFLDDVLEAASIAQSETGNLSFIRIGGEPALLYSCSEGLMVSKDLETASCLLEKGEMSGTEYQIVNGEEKDFILGTETTEEGTNIVAYIWRDQDQMLSDKIFLSKQNDYIKNPNGFYEDGVCQIAFSRTSFSVLEEELERNTEICWMEFGEYSDLAIENLELDQEQVKPGETMLIKVDVKNQGVRQEQEYEVQIYADGKLIGNKRSADPLEIGAIRTEEVEIQIPKDCALQTSLLCKVVGTADDAYMENNVMQSLLGYIDLEVDIFRNDKNKNTPVSVYVTNCSAFDTGATLKIYDSDEEGELLKSYQLEELEAGKIKSFTISSEELSKMDKDVLYATVESMQPEQCMSNNYTFLYVRDLIKNSDTNTGNGSQNNTSGGTNSGNANSGSNSSNKKPSSGGSYTDYTNLAPGKIKLKKVKSTAKRTLLVNWEFIGSDGYQIQYAQNKTFTKKMKKKNVSWMNWKFKLKKLKSKKKYFVRIRAYNTDHYGNKYYGPWSNVKKCKVK